MNTDVLKQNSTEAAAGIAEAASTPCSVAFEQVFNFKTIKPEKLEELKNRLDAPIPEGEMEEIKDDDGKITGYKRKAVTASLIAPDFITALPELAASLIKNFISEFVKSEYIDNFTAVGQHDWDFVAAKMAASSRRGSIKIDISDETWANAAASFYDFFLEVLQHKAAAERLSAIMAGKFSQTAINKNANEFSETICTKLQSRLVEWAEWAAENTETPEEFEPVFNFVSGRLDKHLAKLSEANVNLTDVL